MDEADAKTQILRTLKLLWMKANFQTNPFLCPPFIYAYWYMYTAP